MAFKQEVAAAIGPLFKDVVGRSGMSRLVGLIDLLDKLSRHPHTMLADPGYYQSCGALLYKIFTMVDAKANFPSLIEQSAAARDVAESVQIERRLEVSLAGYYPQLSVLLHRVSA